MHTPKTPETRSHKAFEGSESEILPSRPPRKSFYAILRSFVEPFSAKTPPELHFAGSLSSKNRGRALTGSKAGFTINSQPPNYKRTAKVVEFDHFKTMSNNAHEFGDYPRCCMNFYTTDPENDPFYLPP